MGRRQTEKGEFELPAGEFNRFVREFSDFWDKRMAELCSLADWVYQNRKGKTILSVLEEAHDNRLPYKGQQVDDALDAFMPADYRKNVRKPLKKDLRAQGFKNKCKGDDGKRMPYAVFSFTSDAEIIIHFDDRRVVWDVDESKNAVDEARAHPVGKWFFDFLKGVKWRGRTGGEVQYMDEYMEDAGQLYPSSRDMHGWVKAEFEKRVFGR